MSKYKEIQTQIKSIAFICQALRELDIPYEVAMEGAQLPLIGYEGRQRPERADVVVRRYHLDPLSNDMGWAHNPETGAYDEIISEFDQHSKAARIAKQVRQRCAFLQVEQLAMANGYTVNVVEDHGVQRVLLGGVR
jgi:hypothetical protein